MAKAEYPKLGNGEHYRKWLEQYVCSQNINLIKSVEIYKLRNSMLHQGSPTTKRKGKTLMNLNYLYNLQIEQVKLCNLDIKTSINAY